MRGKEEASDFDEFDDEAHKNQFLAFKIGEGSYAIAIRHIVEIVTIQKITEVPDVPSFVKGVINLRGQVIPVMDVRLRFGMDWRDYDDRTCVIVVQHSELQVGLVVDTVWEVSTIPEEQIAPPPRREDDPSEKYIAGLGRMGDDLRIILDVARLLNSESSDAELEALAGQA
jgi:purine-binding chemotaxis protein CheW